METEISVPTDVAERKGLLLHKVTYTKRDLPESMVRIDVTESRLRAMSTGEHSPFAETERFLSEHSKRVRQE
jgi:hypothetical protein